MEEKRSAMQQRLRHLKIAAIGPATKSAIEHAVCA